MNTDSLKQLWKTVFGDPDAFIDAFFRVAYSPERCRCIEENGQAISALYWLDCECEDRKLAYIYAVATDPAHRGKGLASQLLTDTHAQLKASGYSGAVLKPAKGLFPFYERLGYTTTGYVRCFHAEAAAEPVALKALSAEEHALLRRSYLPENSVLQEGVTLEFLHLFARAYAAQDALICVDREEPVVLEYLGNPDSAPGILAALGIGHAEIRTPGQDIPFVMYFGLDSSPAPGYLGITLE